MRPVFLIDLGVTASAAACFRATGCGTRECEHDGYRPNARGVAAHQITSETNYLRLFDAGCCVVVGHIDRQLAAQHAHRSDVCEPVIGRGQEQASSTRRKNNGGLYCTPLDEAQRARGSGSIEAAGRSAESLLKATLRKWMFIGRYRSKSESSSSSFLRVICPEERVVPRA